VVDGEALFAHSSRSVHEDGDGPLAPLVQRLKRDDEAVGGELVNLAAKVNLAAGHICRGVDDARQMILRLIRTAPVTRIPHESPIAGTRTYAFIRTCEPSARTPDVHVGERTIPDK